MADQHEHDRPALARALVEDVRLLSYRSQRLAGAFAEQQGMHPTDLEALVHVMHAEGAGQPLTAGGLSAALALSAAATTGVVDRLERAGRVRRERPPSDRRRVELRTTPEAMAVAGAFFGPLGRRSDEEMAAFTTAELDAAHRLLVALSAAVAELEEQHRRPAGGGAPASAPGP